MWTPPTSALRFARRCGLVLIAVLATGATSASADVTTFVPTGSGLTTPTGAAVDGSGTLWVSDHLEGICRVEPGRVGGALVRDDWCDIDRQGPEEPGQLAYDPVNNLLFVAEGSSGSSGVWRLHLDVTGAITSGEQIVDTSANDERVLGLALGLDGVTPVLEFTSTRTALVRRIPNPGTCTVPCSRSIVGSAQNEDTPSLARVGSTLYLAEPTGVTRLTGAGAGQVAQPVAGLPGGVPTALAADAAGTRLYAGTTNPSGGDQVDVLDIASQRVETYAIGFSAVGAMTTAPDGTLYVVDDPGVIGVDVTGAGRVFAVSPQELSRASVTISAGPPTFSNLRTATFAYTALNATSLECRTDGAAWAPCGVGASGTSALADLADGLHVFEVRAVSASGSTGPVTRRTFVVDVTAPIITIDDPVADAVLSQNRVLVQASASEPMSSFACSVDGAPATACSEATLLESLSVGRHTFVITGLDLAGNASAPAEVAVTVSPPAVKTPPPAAPGRDTSDEDDSNSGRGDGGRERSVAVVTTADSLRLAERGAPDLALRFRQAMNQRRKLATLRRKRSLRLVVDASADATAVVVELLKPGTSAGPPIAVTTRPAAGAGTVIDWRLTPRQVKRLRPGLHRVRITLTAGSATGPSVTTHLRLVRGR